MASKLDFRIKQCTEITTSWVFVSHHEMGHIEYYLQYAPEPTVFRDGANPGITDSMVQGKFYQVLGPKWFPLSLFS